ncbi:5-carboxymethyl-2-hydroxymuconate isomerase [Betaproteobacteria bacterium GR16-43]|nr:5-carboxymethyl-2-hydroxymuconate isomerase [Betaproteobacteria bacterium GR16-43]
MKLVTYSPLPSGKQRPGILLDDKTIVEATGFATMIEIIQGGASSMEKLKALAAKPGTTVKLADVKLHAPIPRPLKNVFCVGWNYLEHFEEGAKKLEEKRELPKHPVFFSKTPTAVNDPTGTIPFDAAISTSLDWEVELGVIIGTTGKNIGEADAMKHVFGYTVLNDVTWRDVQRRHGGQWHKGKSFDGTCPMGPSIITADSLDHTNLKVECRVNGVVKQSSNTRFMYFKVPRLIAELSAGMTLEAGDVISSGTPEGVGFARTPPEFLKPGDLLETEIEGIGVLRNPVGS